MKTFATINSHPVRISGFPHSGWWIADTEDPNAKTLPFRFTISDDGSGNFIMTYASLDGAFTADTWHETIEDAIASAIKIFDIERPLWTYTKKAEQGA